MNRLAPLTLIAPLALVACGDKDQSTTKAPTGQVAATAAGKEITSSEVRLELGAGGSDPAVVASQQPAALRAVINRKLLAAAAVERGLDKTPIAAMVMDKARDLALISVMQQAIEAQVPKVSPEEAANYVRDNPTAFSQRRLVALEQLVVPQVSPALIKQMEPLNTLEEIIALLEKNKVAFRRGQNAIDPLAIEPEAARKIAQLNVGSVFVTPAGNGATVSRIREVASQPLTGDEAIKAATSVLMARRVNGQIRDQFEAIIKNGQSTVKINDAYADTKAKAK